MESDGCVTVASMFDISYGTAFTILTEYLEVRRVLARWIPRLLTEDDKAKRVQLSRAFLGQYTNEDDFL